MICCCQLLTIFFFLRKWQPRITVQLRLRSSRRCLTLLTQFETTTGEDENTGEQKGTTQEVASPSEQLTLQFPHYDEDTDDSEDVWRRVQPKSGERLLSSSSLIGTVKYQTTFSSTVLTCLNQSINYMCT